MLKLSFFSQSAFGLNSSGGSVLRLIAALLFISFCSCKMEEQPTLEVNPADFNVEYQPVGSSTCLSIHDTEINSSQNLESRGFTVPDLKFKYTNQTIEIGKSKGWRVPVSNLENGVIYLMRVYVSSGEVSLTVSNPPKNGYYSNIGTRYTKSGRLREISFTKPLLTSTDAYLLVTGSATFSNFDVALYQLSYTYPSTVITTKTSALPAGVTSLFTTNGQCVWYAWLRIAELYASGYLSTASYNQIYNGLYGKTNRHAKYWPSMIAGNWVSTSSIAPLPKEKRKKGMLVVWIFGDYGHIGFVEQVSNDLTKFVVSDFNQKNDEKYRTTIFTYGSDSFAGAYPVFLELESIK